MLVRQVSSNLTIALLRLAKFGPPSVTKVLAIPRPTLSPCKPCHTRTLARPVVRETTPACVFPAPLPELPAMHPVLPVRPDNLVFPLHRPVIQSVPIRPADAWRYVGRTIDLVA